MGDVTRIVVDTDILLHDTFEDSEKHAEASELLDEADRIYLASIVVHEYLWLLLTKFKIDIDSVREKLEEYFSDARFIYISENSEVFMGALDLMKEDKADPSMINDYIILVLAQRMGATLATYDEELREIAKKLGVPVAP
ncbi:PIN domain-containing protein [Thermofilum pendens]|uniref:Ribonuclease VapC n=1 Tax=Thermofilum pendens (strain DSM 2475 / Hrk 5) TaxID=368408 RepID=A1RW58_THEPD|nr:PIN domain-containing protein [Thermofilum pendens]ABL77438.1 PilT protein domain protein [Thermofilum pendens Hrk 5]